MTTRHLQIVLSAIYKGGKGRSTYHVMSTARSMGSIAQLPGVGVHPAGTTAAHAVSVIQLAVGLPLEARGRDGKGCAALNAAYWSGEELMASRLPP